MRTGTREAALVSLGPTSLNVRGIGLCRRAPIGDVAIATREGTPIRVRDIGARRDRLSSRASVASRSAATTTSVVATVLLRKGDDAQSVLERLHAKIARRESPHSCRAGVKISPYYDRTRLMHLTTHTVLDNLLHGILLVTLVLFVFLGNARAALIVAVTIPLLAAVRVHRHGRRRRSPRTSCRSARSTSE